MQRCAIWVCLWMLTSGQVNGALLLATNVQGYRKKLCGGCRIDEHMANVKSFKRSENVTIQKNLVGSKIRSARNTC